MGNTKSHRTGKKNINEQTDRQTELHLAIKDNTLEEIENILQKTKDLNVQDSEGITPLHICMRKRSLKVNNICRLLLERGASAYLRDKYGETPLHLAIQHNPDCVPMILSSASGKASVNVKDTCGSYPIHVAVKACNVAVLEQLLDNGAGVDSEDIYGLTPLHWAKTEDCVNMLIDRGAQVNAKDNDGMTPLHHAVKYNRVEVLEPLLVNRAGINIRDCDGRTPLMYVASLEVTRLLLQMGADVSIKDHSGQSALSLLTRSEIPKKQVIKNEMMNWSPSLIRKESES